MKLPRRRALTWTAAWTGGALLGSRAAHADLVSVIAATRGSVLPVGTFSPTDSPRFGFRGTGFVVGDGTLIVTNAHVLPAEGSPDAAKRIAVITGRRAGPSGGELGEGRMATIAITDRTRDLALLKIEGPPLPALTLEDAGAVREGQSIGLMGYPIGGALGFAPVTHRGIIASLTTIALPAATAAQLDPRAIARLRDGNFEVLQLDATAYPGNSGGPVFDADTGRVLGVVNMVLVKGSRESALSHPTGITYAIPVRHVQALLDEYRAGAPTGR
jgi:S1-C subfamily serine protease